MTKPYTKLPVADVEAAIKQYRGNITRVADHFGVKRSVIYLKIRSKPTLV
jgi:transcriptional regulator of acetoin/glycerol metabolism